MDKNVKYYKQLENHEHRKEKQYVLFFTLTIQKFDVFYIFKISTLKPSTPCRRILITMGLFLQTPLLRKRILHLSNHLRKVREYKEICMLRLIVSSISRHPCFVFVFGGFFGGFFCFCFFLRLNILHYITICHCNIALN